MIRRSTTLLVVAGEYSLFAKHPSRRSLAALALMVGGAVVAGASDLTFSLPGYIWVSICVVSTAAYLLLIKKLQDSTGGWLVGCDEWVCGGVMVPPRLLPVTGRQGIPGVGLFGFTPIVY